MGSHHKSDVSLSSFLHFKGNWKLLDKFCQNISKKLLKKIAIYAIISRIIDLILNYKTVYRQNQIFCPMIQARGDQAVLRLPDL